MHACESKQDTLNAGITHSVQAIEAYGICVLPEFDGTRIINTICTGCK